MDSLAWGIACCSVAPLLYGSIYVPIKRYEAYDGTFTQLMMCVGQLLVGAVVAAWTGFPHVYPLAMIGGALYAIGNSLAFPIMDGLGMALGSLIWNSLTVLVGWAVARFGLFGTKQEIPTSNALNILGVVIATFGGGLFMLVENRPISVRPPPFVYRDQPPKEHKSAAVSDCVEKKAQKEKEKEQTPAIPFRKRLTSLLLCVFCSLCLGNMTTPINYIVSHPQRNESVEEAANVMKYLFSHFYGAFLASITIFVVYSMTKKNVPLINPETACPALLSGILYGASTCLLFVANNSLGQVIAFPVIGQTPGIVVSMWSILLFKEIQGVRNYLKLAVAFIITTVGAVMIVLSK